MSRTDPVTSKKRASTDSFLQAQNDNRLGNRDQTALVEPT